MVHNEWRGTYDEFEEAVELGDLEAFLRIDPNMRSASSVSSQPKVSIQSTTRDVKPGPTQMPAFSGSRNERRVLQDDDDMLSFLPQGTTITDAEVDALLKELEKPLPRTTRRSYTPSNRARNSPLPLPTMPKDRPQAPGEPTKYDPDAMLSRNLVSEAAKAIGVSPTPRKFAPRMRLNKRSTEEIMKERRARMEQAENNRKNDELFDTLGLSDMRISEEEAEAFLTKGIIPTPQKQTRLSLGGNSHDHPDGNESLHEEKLNATDQNKNVAKNQEDITSKDTLTVEHVADDVTPSCFNTEPEHFDEPKPCSTHESEFEEVQVGINTEGSEQAKLHEDDSQATTKPKMENAEEKNNNLDSNEVLADDQEFAPSSMEAIMPNSVPEEAQNHEQDKSQIVKELEALNEANMRDSSFISEVSLHDKKDIMDTPSQSETPTSTGKKNAMDTKHTMAVPILVESNVSSSIDSTKLDQAAPTSKEDLKDSKDPALSAAFMDKEGADQVPEPTSSDHVKLSCSTKQANPIAKDANEYEFLHNVKSEPELEEEPAPESKEEGPVNTPDMAIEPEMLIQDNTMELVQSEASASQESKKLVSLESSDQEGKDTLIKEAQTQVNKPEGDETSFPEAGATSLNNFAENDAMETNLLSQEPSHNANDNRMLPARVLPEAPSNEAITETHSQTYSEQYDENLVHTVSELQKIDFVSKEPTQVSEILDQTVQGQKKPHVAEFTGTERNEDTESKASLDDKTHCIETPDAQEKGPSKMVVPNASKSAIPNILHAADFTGCNERDKILHSNANGVDASDSHILNSSSRETHESSIPAHAEDNSFNQNTSSSTEDTLSTVKDLSSSGTDIPSTMEDASNPSNVSSSVEGALTLTRDASSSTEDVLHSIQDASSVQDIPSATEGLSTIDSLLIHEDMASRPVDSFTENDQHGTEHASCSNLKDSPLEKTPVSMDALSVQENPSMLDETCLNKDVTNECPTNTAFERTSNVDSNTVHSVSCDKSMHPESTTVPSVPAEKETLDETMSDTPAPPPTTTDLPGDNPAFQVKDRDLSVDGLSENLHGSSATDTEPFKDIDTCKKPELPRASSLLSDHEILKTEKIDTSQLESIPSNTAEFTSSVQHLASSNSETPRKLSLAERLERATKASPVSPVVNSNDEKDTRSPFPDEDGDTTMLIHPACHDEKDSDQGPELVSNEDAKNAMDKPKPTIALSDNDQHGSDAGRVSGSYATQGQDADACDLQMNTELIQPYRQNTSGSIGETSHGSDSEYESEDVPDLWVTSENTPPSQEFFGQATSSELCKMQDDSSVQNVLDAPLLDLSTPTDPPRDTELSVSPASNEQDVLFTHENLPASATGPPPPLPKRSMPKEDDIRSVSEATALSARRKSPPLPRHSQDNRDMARRTVSEAPSSVKDIKATSKNKNHTPRRTLSDIMREADQILQEWK